MIPVTVLTGFLGSGKTTLLARLLRHRDMGRTAIIVNEFGEVGIDHDLIATSDESFVQLSNGCLCCNVRSDLVLTLGELAARRDAGTVSAFERVVIETSGLADPAPILHALMTDPEVAARFALDGVVATVDALTGVRALECYGESLRQVALADCIVVTKTDLAPAAGVEQRVRSINPDIPVLHVVKGDIAPSILFASAARAARLPAAGSPAAAMYWSAEASHSGGIGSISIVRHRPVHAATLALFVSALADNCGPDLLRMKGIVAVVEEPERPAIIHGVQHVYHAPAWLARWPSADRRTRLVLIGRRMRTSWVQELLDLLDAEVADQLARCARPQAGNAAAATTRTLDGA
ncbi:MAG: GTP-binding protein [Burkholderiales bacterium]|nr:GTP-binding protein [Burkholderiales bacterium]